MEQVLCKFLSADFEFIAKAYYENDAVRVVVEEFKSDHQSREELIFDIENTKKLMQKLEADETSFLEMMRINFKGRKAKERIIEFCEKEGIGFHFEKVN